MEKTGRKPKDAEYYDQVFTGSNRYNVCYKDSVYYTLYSQIISWLRQMVTSGRLQKNPKILEIGCGTGQLAHYLYDEGFRKYRGFDFSATAIEIAQQFCPKQSLVVGDAFDPRVYQLDYDVAIATEVLEHVGDDFAILNNLKVGKTILFTLPTRDDPSHMRVFQSSKQVVERYSQLVDVKGLVLLDQWFAVLGNVAGPVVEGVIVKEKEDG